jgi:Cu+-exporting ATPase
MPSLEDDDNPELRDFTRRFWWTLPLTAVCPALAMLGTRIPSIAPLSAPGRNWR